MTQALLTAEPATTSTGHVVQLRDVVMRFRDKQVLDHVSLAVAPQERLVIIGQSGAGKTTILRLILGILKPNAGSVFFRQHEVSRMNDHQLEQVRMRIGMVYQDAALLSSFTVRENLALPLQELTNKTPGEIDRIVDEKLEMVEMTGEDKAMPFELSGGMRKRVGLARALVMEPELILFDEPTQGLDPVIGALIDKLIIDLTEKNENDIDHRHTSHGQCVSHRDAHGHVVLRRNHRTRNARAHARIEEPCPRSIFEWQRRRTHPGAQQISHALPGRLDQTKRRVRFRHRRKFLLRLITQLVVFWKTRNGEHLAIRAKHCSHGDSNIVAWMRHEIAQDHRCYLSLCARRHLHCVRSAGSEIGSSATRLSPLPMQFHFLRRPSSEQRKCNRVAQSSSKANGRTQTFTITASSWSRTPTRISKSPSI